MKHGEYYKFETYAVDCAVTAGGWQI